MNNENRDRAARISAQMVEPFVSVSGIEDGLTELLDVHDLNRLFTTVEPKFAEYEQRLELSGMDEDAYLAIIAARQTAYFNLGFAAAVRLMGRTTPPPKLKAVSK
jgi:hypothetical protein